MNIIYEIITTIAIGIFSGFIGAIAGSGGLISIPFMMFLGLPAQVAVATNKFGAVGLSMGAAYKFWKEKRIIWKYALPLSAISIIGGLIGTRLLIDIDQKILTNIVGIILLAMLPLIFIRKDIGSKHRKATILQKSAGFILYFLISVFGGFFGGGTGALIFYCLMIFMGLTLIDANAADIVPWLLLSSASLIMCIASGIVSYHIGFALFAGMLIGGYMGAHTAIKKGNTWVKLVFGIVVVCAGLKILLF